MSITGWEGTPPTRVGLSFGDLSASVFTAFGIATALYQREKTGQGQKIDVAMLDCQVALLENALVRYQVEGASPKPLGNRHPSITPFQAVKAQDKYFVIAVGNDNLWEKFCHALNNKELLHDERFKTNTLRSQHINELNDIMTKIFAHKTAEEWLTIIDNAGVPCAPINDVEGIMQDKQILARNMIVTLEDKTLGKIKLAGNPVKMTLNEDPPKREHSPEIGENNNEILSKILAYSSQEINDLKKRGII